jgi:outer membrane receptor protein involved in Fe transport
MTLKPDKTFPSAVWRWCGAVAALFSPTLVAAAPSNQLEQLLEMRFEDLMAVKVVTASKTTESALAAPAPVTVVTADDIRSFGWRTLGDALRTMPGLQVSYDRQYQFLGVRGINRRDFNSRVLVLIDGRRTNENVYDQGFIEEAFLLDMEAIDRIEFVSGPGSSLYGNNAMLGVVNVVTKKAVAMKGSRLVAEVASQSAARLYLEHGRSLDNGSEFSMSGSVMERRGADLYYPEHNTVNNGVASRLDGERVKKFFAQYRLSEWRVQTGLVERIKQDPNASYGSVFADPDARFIDRQIFVSLSNQTRLSDSSEAFFQLARNSYHYGNSYHYAVVSPDPLNQDHTHGDWWQGEARWTYTGWNNHRLIAGVDIQRDNKQGYENRDQQPAYPYWVQHGSSTKAGVFVDDVYSINSNWQIDLGLRIDQYQTNAAITSCDTANIPECSTRRFESNGTRRSPRVALIYKLQDNTVLKLMSGKAFRAPNPSELGYFSPVGVAMLGRAQPERFGSREVSIEHFVHSNYKLWANAFNYQLKGVIGRDATDTYVNQNDISSSGLVIGGEWRDGKGTTLRVSISHSKAKDSVTGARLDDAPVNLGRLNYAFNLPDTRWRAGLEVQSHSSRLNSAGNRVDGASLVNLTLSSAKLFDKADVSVSFYNLLGRRYADPAVADQAPVQQIAQNGRLLRFQMEWRF